MEAPPSLFKQAQSPRCLARISMSSPLIKIDDRIRSDCATAAITGWSSQPLHAPVLPISPLKAHSGADSWLFRFSWKCLVSWWRYTVRDLSLQQSFGGGDMAKSQAEQPRATDAGCKHCKLLSSHRMAIWLLCWNWRTKMTLTENLQQSVGHCMPPWYQAIWHNIGGLGLLSQ